MVTNLQQHILPYLESRQSHLVMRPNRQPNSSIVEEGESETFFLYTTEEFVFD